MLLVQPNPFAYILSLHEKSEAIHVKNQQNNENNNKNNSNNKTTQPPDGSTDGWIDCKEVRNNYEFRLLYETSHYSPSQHSFAFEKYTAYYLHLKCSSAATIGMSGKNLEEKLFIQLHHFDATATATDD